MKGWSLASRRPTLTASLRSNWNIRSSSPGDYIKLSDPRYQTGWQSMAMVDDGTGGDTFAGDGIYAVTLPGNLQTHRRLIRYRIHATDTEGASVTAPYGDDRQPNFAYFVYDGVPDWTGRGTPSLPPVTYDFDTLGTGPEQYPYQQQVPVYHLITTREEHEESQHIPNASTSSYGGSEYRWEGALVYDGEVYDHIRFRARAACGATPWVRTCGNSTSTAGAASRRATTTGRSYGTDWSKLNFSALIQAGELPPARRAGPCSSGAVSSCTTSSATPRLRRTSSTSASSSTPMRTGQPARSTMTTSRDSTSSVEQMDGQFLEEHGLPDGNLYKMESGTGTLNNQGPTQPEQQGRTSTISSSTRAPSRACSGGGTTSGWRTTTASGSIATAIHDYDIHANKNYFYFHDPIDDRWRVLNLGPGPDLDDDPTTVAASTGRCRNRVLAISGVPDRSTATACARSSTWSLTMIRRARSSTNARVSSTHPDSLRWPMLDRAMWDHNPIMTFRFCELIQGRGRALLRGRSAA